MTLTPKLAGNISDDLLYRARSEGGFSCSESLILLLLSLCQNSTNAFLKRVLTTASLTLTPEKPLYDLNQEFTNCHRIVSIRDEEELLDELKGWKELFHLDTCWFRHPAIRAKSWCQVGDYLAIYPQPKSAVSLTVTYVKDLQLFTSTQSEIELPDEDLAFCMDIAEMVLLTMSSRGNKIEEATVKMKEFMLRYGLIVPTIQDRSTPIIGED